jgi:hypothetical protein
VSSARRVNEGGALEKPVPSGARQAYEQSKHPENWAAGISAPFSARQVNEQASHGGARPGSGRPRVDSAEKVKSVGLSLPPHLIVWIEEASVHAGVSKSAFVAEVLERSRRAALRRSGQ